MASLVMVSSWQRPFRRVFSVAKPLIMAAALPLVLAACSGGQEEKPDGGVQTGDDRLFVPEGLSVTKPTEGSSGVFNVLALTLRQERDRTEVYAALRNDGKGPACTVGLTIALVDGNGDVMAQSSVGLPTQRFYRFSFDPTAEPLVAGCVAPGEVSMGAVLDLPSLDTGLESMGVSYWLTYWDQLDGLTPLQQTVEVESVKPVMRSGGVAYTGVLVNGLDEPRLPGVSIFPVNRVGRPLGIAYTQGSEELPHGGRWEFETTIVPEAGTDFVAYPAGR